MKKLLVLLAVLIPVISIAHPGHGVVDNNGFIHMLLSHGLLVGFAAVAMGIGVYLMRREKKQ